MYVLLLGYSSIAQRRVIPALEAIKQVESFDIASKSYHQKRPLKSKKNLRIFSDYIEALEKSEANVVYISTINSLHEMLAQAALESGRHVIVDKPAFLTLSATKRIIALAKTQRLGVAETTVFMHHPQFTFLKSLTDQFSPLKRIISSFTMPPFPASNYRLDPDLGGGALHDLGPYVAATSRFFFNSPPKFLSLRVLNRDKKTNADIAFSMIADFGLERSLIGSFGFDTEYTNSLKLLFSNCCIKVDRIFSTPPDFKNQIQVQHKNQIKYHKTKSGDSFELMLSQILDGFASSQYEIFFSWMTADSAFREKLLEETKR